METSAGKIDGRGVPAGNRGDSLPGFTRGRTLDFNLYRRALEGGAGFGLPSIRLGRTGEPLLNQDIPRWVGEARQKGVLDISLITNGRLLSPKVSRELMDAGLTRLMISVDAGSEEIYRRVRPGGDWQALLANIDSFLEIREKLGSALPLLRVSFVEMSLNQGQRPAFEERFGPLADYLSFQRYQNILGAAETDFSLPEAGPVGEQESPEFCSEPFTRLALHADGGLFPCCSDFGRRKPLGNLAAGGILAIWTSAEARFLAGSGAAQAEPCRSCRARSV